MTDTKPIRTGEELDVGKLGSYLSEHLAESAENLRISQFPAGASNLTYCVKVGDEEYVLRRPPFGSQVKTAHDMSREFNVLSKLSRVYRPSPRPILYCDDESVIGSEFYLMERRKGLIIRGRVSGERLAVSSEPEADPDSETESGLADAMKQAETRPQGSVPADSSRNEDATNHPDAEASPLLQKEGSSESRDLNSSATYQREVCESFIQNLVDLHALDYEAAGLGDLGKPEGYTKRQVKGWTKRYFKAKTDEWKELEDAINWLNQNIPDDDPPALVHNDYKFDNVMLNPEDLTEIVAVLDWEMATIGSPLMDLGTTLAYWMSKDYGDEMLSMPFNPRILMENISRRELVEMYAEKSGRDVSNILYYYVFGSFKVAVIAQQIYYRFAKGFTQDKRFANFSYFVKRLGEIGAASIGRNGI